MTRAAKPAFLQGGDDVEAVGAAAASPSLARVAAAPDGALMVLPQTFSTSGRPRMPDGMKISTIARIEKAATSL